MEKNNFIQVPVINKTASLFIRDEENPTMVTSKLSKDFTQCLDAYNAGMEQMIVTVKTDGTCGMVCKVQSQPNQSQDLSLADRDENNCYYLMRRQDIKIKSRNYQSVMNNGICSIFCGMPCYITKIIRGSGKLERLEPFYIFQLTPDSKPDIDNGHVIGFTPLLHDFPDDKHAISAIDGFNGTTNVRFFTTTFNGSLNVGIRSVSAAELMDGLKIMTVEIMGSKISNKYGFTNNKHFINPHGSIVYPMDLPYCQDAPCGQALYPKFDYDAIKEWFESEALNPWANVEGFVIHFLKSNKRFKVHRGHVGLEKTWVSRKTSGINFLFES